MATAPADRLAREAEKRAPVFREPVDIAAPGHAVTTSWSAVAGVTAAEVTSANLTLYPAVAEETHDNANFGSNGAGWSITVPARRRIKAIALVGLKQPGQSTLTDALPSGMRLSVAFPPVQGGGFDTPRFSVPAVGPDNAVPPTLTGASFSSGVLRMTPAIAATRVRVALVTGANPPEFSDQATELTKVNLTTHAAAQNAKVIGPDGTVVWEMPEFDPDAVPAEVDLRHVLEAEFNRRVQSGGPFEATCTIVADTPARMGVVSGRATGFLLRVEGGVARSVLEGDPATPAFDDFASETPQSATGDLTIRYDGIRILETVSDPIPAGPSQPVSGAIVATAAAVRALPPLALEGLSPARVGVFGRAPEACELAIEFVNSINATGAPIAPPAVVAVEAGGSLRTHWAELPANLVLAGAAAVRVRANSGRFSGRSTRPVSRSSGWQSSIPIRAAARSSSDRRSLRRSTRPNRIGRRSPIRPRCCAGRRRRGAPICS
jgi:hypothetical protein